MVKHSSPISGIAVRDGLVLTAGYDNRLILWQDGRPQAVNYHDHLVNACHFQPGGDLVVSASSDRTARVWRLPTLAPVATLFGHEDDVEMAVFSPAGDRIATACRDGRVRVFASDGRALATLAGHRADVTSVAWSTDGREIFSSSDDGTVRKWCATDFRELGEIALDGVETDTVAVTGDRTVFAGNDDGEICVLREGWIEKVPAHAAGVKRIVVAPDGQRVLSLSYDRHLCVFDVTGEGLKLTHRTRYPTLVWARSAAFVDDRHIAFGTFGDKYAVFDLQTDTWITDDVGPTGGLNTVHASPLGLLAVGDSGDLRAQGERGLETVASLGELCNFVVSFRGTTYVGGQTGRVFRLPEADVLADLGQPLNCAVATKDALVFGGYTGEAFRIDPASGEVLLKKRLLKNAIKAIALGGELGLAVGAARDLCWFDPQTLEPIAHESGAHDKIANGCAHLTGTRFASVSRDLRLRIFDYATGEREVVVTPLNHSVKCVATDGRLIAVGSYGGQVALYDSETRRWVAHERPTRSGISALAYREGRFFASSYDGRVYEIEASA